MSSEEGEGGGRAAAAAAATVQVQGRTMPHAPCSITYTYGHCVPRVEYDGEQRICLYTMVRTWDLGSCACTMYPTRKMGTVFPLSAALAGAYESVLASGQ